MLAFPASPTVGQQFQTWTWDGVKWTPTPVLSIPNCGYLKLASTSPSASLIFAPYIGDLIRINGLNYHIPSAGITVAYNNCFIDGVAGSTLAYSTLYRVYAFMHATLGMQLDFSATAHATSTQAGNVGVEIKSGDNTRTLVGIIYTSNSTTPFFDSSIYRWTRSWFNRRAASFYNLGGGTFAGYSGQAGVLCACFQDEAVSVLGTWYGTADTAANAQIIFTLNSTQVGSSGNVTTVNTTASYENMTAMYAGNLNEGLNSFSLNGSMTAGWASGSCAITGMLG
jgi:hypothetical protein